MWFETLTGFSEESAQQVHANLVVDGHRLTSRVNGKTFVCGSLETPSLAELRERVRGAAPLDGKVTVRELVANVQELHKEESNASALFQVASQFNLLEMVSPTVTPERGVGIYEYDHTQGPACAIAAGAGTIYRHYFASVNGKKGQTTDNQIDCLLDMGAALGNTDNRLWEMKNGYVMASRYGLEKISESLRAASDDERDALRGLLRVGLQWRTQVTLAGCQHVVSQVYCSALPVAYSSHPPVLWEAFATLILEAAYEATLCAAVLNARENGNNTVFLTLLGGGAFGNHMEWILNGIERAIRIHAQSNLEIVMVSYGKNGAAIRR